MKTILCVIGSDLLAKVVVLASSPMLSYALSESDFATFIVLQSVLALTALVQFGGADLSLGINASDPQKNRDEVFAGCTHLAMISLGIVWTLVGALLLYLGATLGISKPVALLLVAAMFPLSVGAWHIYVLRIARENIVFAIATLALKFAPFLLALLAAVLWRAADVRLQVYFAALFIAVLCAALFVVGWRRRRVPFPSTVGPNGIWPYLSTGVITLPASLAYACIWTLDKPLTRLLWDDAAVGSIGVAALLGATILLLRGWLSLLWEPVIIEMSHNDDERLMSRAQTVFDTVVMLFAGAAVIGILLGPDLIDLLYPNSLNAAKSLVGIYFLAAAFAGINSVLSATILIAQAPKAQLVNMLVAVTLFFLLFWQLQDVANVFAAPWAIIGAELWILAFYSYLGRSRFRNLPLSWKNVLLPVAIFFGLALLLEGQSLWYALGGSAMIALVVLHALKRIWALSSGESILS